jgi:prephenate dehydratase
MELRTNMILGALGGPNTFGGDAAHRLRELYPEFGDIVYFRTSDEGLAFDDGRADAMCAPQQMSNTGFHPGIQARIASPDSKLYVVAEVTHQYHCSFLVKRGSRLDQIKRVLGHTGSVTQSRPWLEENVPQADIVIVHTNSMGAAQEVAEGDGSLASVGTPGMARQYDLEELVKDIDGGSVGSYWALSPHSLFSERPSRLVVAGRFHDDGVLTDLIGSLGQAGFRLHTVYPQATGRRLYEYDCVLRLAGQGSLSAVQDALSPYATARLAGAFDARE